MLIGTVEDIYVMHRTLLYTKPKRCGTSSPAKAVYTPKGFVLHAASLGQAFAHCPIFSTAASRRSVDSVAVPLRQVVLSHLLSVIALVGHYPANKLIDHRPLRERHLATAFG